MTKGKGGRSWSVPPSAFARNIKQAVINHQRWLTIEMPEQITIHTPVGTDRLKTNNIVNVDLPAYYLLDRYDKDGHKTLAMGEAILATLAPYSIVYIRSNLVYASALENGYSDQASAGIYGVSFHNVTARHS